ncbi:MAG: hypothetical protein ACR2L8_12345 [Solirubrobacteraceae bacterium]
MRVLFFMRHHGYVRNFESTLDRLAARGHEVHLAFDQPVEGAYGRPTLACLHDLAERHQGLTYGFAPNSPPDAPEVFARRVRSALDWLRYFEPALAGATKARARVAKRAPVLVRRVVSRSSGCRPAGRRALVRVLRALERETPLRRDDLDFLTRLKPDLVLVTPLVDGGAQTGYVRAARRLGIRSGLCVSSWDNLTSKGLIHEIPDLVTMWNALQRREAIELHGVPDGRIAVTGAQSFDQWFRFAASTSRDEFCAACGLDPERPFLLYMCSSGFISGDEADHVERWIAWLRARPERELREVGVLVRPHPVNAGVWRGRDLAHHGQAALWRLEDTEPATQPAKEEYFDSVHHASAVLGLNSTSLVESAAIGRPVLTLLTPEYAASQEGTAHFGVIAGEDGMLIVARTMEQHAAQLLAALRDPDLDGERRRRFVEGFVRPHGLDVEATGVLVTEIERAAAAPPPLPARPSLGSTAIRAALAPVVRIPTGKEWARTQKRVRRRVRRVRRRVRRRRHALAHGVAALADRVAHGLSRS